MAEIVNCLECDWCQNCDLDPLTNEDDLIQCFSIKKELNKKDKW